MNNATTMIEQVNENSSKVCNLRKNHSLKKLRIYFDKFPEFWTCYKVGKCRVRIHIFKTIYNKHSIVLLKQ